MTEHHAPSVELAAPKLDLLAPDGARLTWQVVAYSGAWRGHHAGEFEFTRATFTKIVENFRAHPQYRKNHSSDVVPWDVSHASELPVSEQPPEGAQIVGWVRDLRVVDGKGGRAELQALTRWLPTGQQKVKSGETPWASVAVVFDAIDPVSGERVGPMLTSIAITPKPFLEDLPRLAAERKHINRPEQGDEQEPNVIDLSHYPGANDYERAMSYVREQPGGAQLSHDDAFRKARQLVLAARATDESKEIVLSADECEDDRPALDISLALGRNRFERVISALAVEHGDSFRRLSFAERHAIASRALRERRIVGE